jgi:hypothetical protein
VSASRELISNVTDVVVDEIKVWQSRPVDEGSRGRFCHSAMPSITFSVMVEMVIFETPAPYTSARWALISPVVRPFADRDRTMSSTPPSRRWRLATICGSKLPSRSRTARRTLSIGASHSQSMFLHHMWPSKSVRVGGHHVGYLEWCTRCGAAQPEQTRGRPRVDAHTAGSPARGTR